MISFEQKDWIISQFKQSYFNSKIKETSTALNFRCPFCGDSKRSKTKARGWLYKREGTFHCFNCGKTTSGFGLLAQIKGVKVSDIKKSFYLQTTDKESIFNKFVVEPIESVNEITDEKTIEMIPSWTDLTDDCKRYLKSRHIFEAPGFDKSSVLYYDTFSDRIVFPWKHNNKIVYYQARGIRKNQTPKYMFPKGLKKQIYGLDKLDLDIPFICFTEGLLDAIFIRNCLAVGGLRPTIEQEHKLELYNKKLIWFSDNYWIDNASKEAIYRVCKYTPRALIFKWDKSCPYKDINEWVCKEKDFNKFWNTNFIQSNIITVAQARVMLELS